MLDAVVIVLCGVCGGLLLGLWFAARVNALESNPDEWEYGWCAGPTARRSKLTGEVQGYRDHPLHLWQTMGKHRWQFFTAWSDMKLLQRPATNEDTE